MATKKTAMKGISRIDSGSTHGWFVRGYRNGKTFSKLFSDLKSGGKGKALKLAKDYRKELHEELTEMPKRSRKRSTLTGRTDQVVISLTNGGPGPSGFAAYSVSRFLPGGDQDTVSFSIQELGELTSLEKALAHAKQGLKEIFANGTTNPTPASRPAKKAKTKKK